MITIDISQEAHSSGEAADLLRHIAEQLDRGYTSGYYPTWSIEGEAEPEDDGAEV